MSTQQCRVGFRFRPKIPTQGLQDVGAESTDFVICRVIKNELKRCRLKHGKKRGISHSACPLPNKKAKMTKKNKGLDSQEEDEEFQKAIEIDDVLDYDAANLQKSMSDFYGILDEQDLVEQGSFSAALLDDQSQMQAQKKEGYFPDLSGLEHQQVAKYSASSSVPGLEDVYFDLAGYVGECSGSEDQHQVAEYSGSGLEVVDDYFFSGLELYQQQEAYAGECSGSEDNKEEEDLGILQCLMDSPVEQLHNEWRLENFFMGESW